MTPCAVPVPAPPVLARRWPRWLPVSLFGVALVVHALLATANWTAGFMPGHEFRQAHTAIITRHIDREDNFSPIYTVPLFGKPWVCPMEFPLYEWSVVGLSRATGWPHVVAARTVSLACFYLMLPAAWLLLGQAGLDRHRRLVPLALILCGPVYVFYSRAFLMESMALMCAAWFLAAFVETLRRRRPGWAVVAAATGAGAGLIKSTTFFVWLLPAAIYGAWSLVREWRTRAGAAVLGRTIAWGVGTAAIPCAAAFWWVKYSDTFKLSHPSAFIFASSHLSLGNFGLANLGARFSAETWGTLLDRWGEAIAPPWLIGGVVVVGAVLLPAHRWRILGAAGLFLAAQQLFPFAYALQEYYFYACAVFVFAAMGWALLGLLEGPGPRWLRVPAAMLLPAALLAGYQREYRGLQLVESEGGTGLTQALRAFTPTDSVIVVLGDDWSPIIPYYADRKALMVRRGLEHDEAYLRRAFDDLAGETIGALVLAREHRGNAALARRIAGRLDLDPEPTFRHRLADVHLGRGWRDEVLRLMWAGERAGSGFEGIEPAPIEAADPSPEQPVPIPPALAAGAFAMVSPAPVRYRMTYGYALWNYEGASVLSLHPDAELWVPPPVGAGRIEWEFGILSSAHAKPGEMTGGVEFTIETESADGTRRVLFRRILEPATVAGDRGRQRASLPYRAEPGELVVFCARPHGDPAFDWAYVHRIDIR